VLSVDGEAGGGGNNGDGKSAFLQAADKQKHIINISISIGNFLIGISSFRIMFYLLLRYRNLLPLSIIIRLKNKYPPAKPGDIY